MTFDLRQLHYAIAAADHGIFYQAARALDVEQSTLSRNILKLERAIGMPIFERSRASVTMTLAGNAFIRGAKPMVATADKLVAMMIIASASGSISQAASAKKVNGFSCIPSRNNILSGYRRSAARS